MGRSGQDRPTADAGVALAAEQTAGAPGARVSSLLLSWLPSLTLTPRLGTFPAVLGSRDQQSWAPPHTQATVTSTQKGPGERGAGGDPDRAQPPPGAPLLQALLGRWAPTPGALSGRSTHHRSVPSPGPRAQTRVAASWPLRAPGDPVNPQAGLTRSSYRGEKNAGIQRLP